MLTLSISEQCLHIAQNLGIFFPDEIKILKSVLREYEQTQSDYVLFLEKKEERVVGFVLFGRIPLTMYGWDIYWLVVDKDHQGKGFGKNLIKRVEEHIVQQNPSYNLRVETSTRKEYAHARNLYLKTGFQEIGRITDFYDTGDDVVIFYKRITAQHL